MRLVAPPAPPAALEVSRHVRDAARSLVYLVLGVGLGAVYLVLVGGGIVLGAVLSLVWIGVPLLALVARAVRRFAEVERRQANRLLEAHLPPLALAPPGQAAWRRGIEEGHRGDFRRALVLLLIKLPVTALALAAAGAPAALTIALLALGFDGLGGGGDRLIGPWPLEAPLGAALCLLALPAAVVSVAVLDAAAPLLRGLARWLLRPRTHPAGPVREILAERLGDRTLSVAYWLPDRGMFVDERGRPVELPDAGSGRAWTAVEHDGRRVAAIVHDAELEASPELVQAAAAAAGLAIDNERLKADLRARVEELRVSRLRIVEAGDAARRRLERDLHDGAQQQLVTLALELRMLRSRLGDHAEAESVTAIEEQLATALAELRELARGIHPAILTERGLAPALAALAGRAPLPVEVEIELEGRLPAPVEAAAYFVIAEGLTNVVRYAQATRAHIVVRRADDELEVVVSDDGVGGANPEGGGLRGLADRLAALEGRLSVEDAPEGGVRLAAHIPTQFARTEEEA